MATLFKPTKPVPVPRDAEISIRDGKPKVRIGSNWFQITADGSKYLSPTKKWYGKFTDGTGVVRRIPLTSDKSAARMLLAELVKKAERQRIGLFDPAEEHATRPLFEHLGDYAAVLESKGDTSEHINQTHSRIAAVLNGCRIAFARDADPVRVADWLNELRRDSAAMELPQGQATFTPSEAARLLGISGTAVRATVKRHGFAATGNGIARTLPRATVEALALRAGKGTGPQTVNHYVRAVRGFFRWLAKVKRIGSNPLDTLELLNVSVDVRRGRRELTVEELQELFRTTRTSDRTFRGLCGEDRYQLYLMAAGTGFRASALAGLTPNDFDFMTPSVTLAAKRNKSRKPKVQPLPSDVADSLRIYLVGRAAQSPVWGGTWAKGHKAAEMLRGDLASAGIPYVVEGPDGPLYADFHSLRHSFLTLGGRAGIDLRTLQELAGHSKPEQTARYSHRRFHDLAGAISKLPALGLVESQKSPEGGDGASPDVPKDVPTPRIRRHRFAQDCTIVGSGVLGGASAEGPEMKGPGAVLHRVASIFSDEGDGGRTRNLRSDSPPITHYKPCPHKGLATFSPAGRSAGRSEERTRRGHASRGTCRSLGRLADAPRTNQSRDSGAPEHFVSAIPSHIGAETMPRHATRIGQFRQLLFRDARLGWLSTLPSSGWVGDTHQLYLCLYSRAKIMGASGRFFIPRRNALGVAIRKNRNLIYFAGFGFLTSRTASRRLILIAPLDRLVEHEDASEGKETLQGQ